MERRICVRTGESKYEKKMKKGRGRICGGMEIERKNIRERRRWKGKKERVE